MQPCPQSFYFGPADKPVMGFWHAPVEPRQPVAVALVGPWGIEGMNLQRTWRQFAQDLAAQGFAVLRFDLDGCGDSYDPNPDSDLIPLWLDTLTHAKTTVLALAGVSRMAWVGFRQGGLLAARHSELHPTGVHALLLLAPPRSGHACLRELKMLEASTHPNPPQAPWALVAAGFPMSSATATSLGQLTLPVSLPGIAVSVLDRQEAPSGVAWTQQLAANGQSVTRVEAQGYAGMMRIAHEVRPATEFFSQAIQLLKESASGFNDQTYPSPACPASKTVLWIRGHAVQEWATPPFGVHGMAAVVVRPGTDAPSRLSDQAILVLNSGAEHRVGPNRMWVGWAREMAARGHTVVRLDLPGLGESNGPAVQASTQVYRDDALHNISAALDWLGPQLECHRWALMGLCSGAYHAVGAAFRDARIERVVAINPFVFFPAQLEEIDLLAGNALQHMVTANTLKSARDPKRWLRLLKGESNIRLIVQSLWGRTRTKLVKKGLEAGRVLKVLPLTPLAQNLSQTAARGCRFHFVFDANEPGWAILKEDIGSLADRMLANGGFTLDTIANGGHSFATLEGRTKMLECTQARLKAWAGQT